MTIFSDKDRTIKLYSYDNNGVFCDEFEYFWAIGTGFAASSTHIKPIAVNDGEVAVFNVDQQKWDAVQDHRGDTVYSTEDKTAVVVDYLGEIKEGFTTLPPSQFSTWNGVAWADDRTEEEKEAYRLSKFPKLQRRQFMRVLVLNGFDLDQIEVQIRAIEDTQTRQLALIDWKDATEFWRTDETLLMVADLLNLTTGQINTMWEQAATL